MNYTLDLIIAICCLSIASNIALVIFIILNRRLKKTKGEVSYDARALLRDLASGPALIKVEYVDRADILLRSPRHL